MVIAEDESTNVKETSHDIDLKCAEKVTDSDNEENMETNDAKAKKPSVQSSGDSLAQDSNSQNANRDFTCKPKPIKAQRDNTLHSYQQIPMYAFNSPKNPTGILPFQPTGK